VRVASWLPARTWELTEIGLIVKSDVIAMVRPFPLVSSDISLGRRLEIEDNFY
jgi:hypothetical protein